MILRVNAIIWTLLFLLISQLSVQAQDSSRSVFELDSIPVGIDVVLTDSILARGVKDSARAQLMGGAANKEDTTISILVSKLELVTTTLNQVNATIRRGFDTVYISQELTRMEPSLGLIRKAIDNQETMLNQRGLLASRVLLNQVTDRLSNWQTNLSKYSQQLSDMEQRVNAVTSDPIFKSIPKDTLLKQMYFQQARELIRKWQATSALFNVYVKNIGVLQSRVGAAFMNVTDMNSEIDFRLREMRRRSLGKEWPYLWEPQPAREVSFFKSIQKSIAPNITLTYVYMRDNWRGTATIGIICLLMFFWIRHLYHKVQQSDTPDLLDPLVYVRRSLALSLLVLFFTIALFVESSPPAVYVEILSLLMLLCATRLSWADWTPAFRTWWLVFIGLFILFGYDNLLFTVSRAERWVVLLLSMIACYTGWKLNRAMKTRPKAFPEHFEKAVVLFMLVQGAAIVFNILGRFSLAKVMGNSAVLVLAFALSLHLIIEIVIEIFFLQAEGNKSNPLAGIFQFNQFKHSLRGWLVLASILVWVAVLLWSLNVFDEVFQALIDWLSKTRSIGSIDFTFKSISIFALVLWLSISISNLLTILFATPQQPSVQGKRQRVGSWVLLLRLGVIGVGFLIAMGAAGIPIDKLAIVIGALGVGIGFGLQNIVSNLVAGIIMAFEKPVAVGDVVEIGTRTGTVKEIGIRSSKITTYDGSEIIVPNSDFISKEVINWTHTSTYRRVELMVGIAYGSDVNKAKQLVMDLLRSHDQVNQHPAPMVLIHELSDSAVTLRVLFWTDFDHWVLIKSDIIASIHASFLEGGISIPFPQTDLHLRSVDPAILAAWTSQGSKSGT
jgi:small-conductance mechanosensitive channel